ncbi:hypothetical protein E4V01_24480 [Methylorubrum sp. Q1]|uniref:hypothetical protein n=1 Tax=Methylorubrum sp. Q1 TaxID=2562453 RepID=UPI0010764A2E|nr:hypothetical protein [Methylorubrum sp. Q1]TFZ54826.1 hypothetical protein E4V01_24480 [Methylorubrum sp. Q1]
MTVDRGTGSAEPATSRAAPTAQATSTADPKKNLTGSFDRNATPPADGTTDLDDKLRVEVDLLTLDTLDHVAQAVAATVVQAVKRGPDALVVVADAALDSAFKLYCQLSPRADLLVAELDVVLGNQAAPEFDPFAGALDIASGLAALLSFFRTDVQYKGREVTIAETALTGALAGHLLRRGVAARTPQRAGRFQVDPPQNGLFARLAKLQALRAKAVGLQGDDALAARAQALAAAVDDLVKAVTVGDADPSKSSVLALLPVVDTLAPELTRAGVYWLRAEVVTAGGSYRSTKGLLARFFRTDRLAVSGGVAVSFTLTEPSTGDLSAADLLYLHSGFRTMPDYKSGPELRNVRSDGLRKDPHVGREGDQAAPAGAPPGGMGDHPPPTEPDAHGVGGRVRVSSPSGDGI